jgi:hypothetical protein
MSRQAITLLELTVLASGAVTACRAVGYDGAQATAQAQKVQGVAVTDAVDKGYFPAVVKGTAIVEAGAAIAKGDSLIVDNQGRAIPMTGALAVKAGGTAVTSTAANGAAILSGGDAPEFVFADALEAASGAGKFIEVLLR